jgi:hypothetical protein
LPMNHLTVQNNVLAPFPTTEETTMENMEIALECARICRPFQARAAPIFYSHNQHN